MAEASWLERNGVTPGKLILIITLGFVLIGIVVYQAVTLMGNGNSVGEGLSPRRRGGSAATREVNGTSRSTDGREFSSNNPGAEVPRKSNNDDSMAGKVVSLPLAVVLRHNPFRLPESLRPPPPIVEPPPSDANPNATQMTENERDEVDGSGATESNEEAGIEGDGNVAETDPVDEERLRKLEQQRAEAEQARLANAAERAAAADRLKTIGVAVVLTSGHEAMAAIGQEFVKVGDVIDGWKVMAIQENGTVLLKPAE
ncbi:MAG: hypothetical protein KDA47_06290 [Planctomycetales bacterium]|nr:hypothetical protein [Planctomycetales bacterium]